MRHIKSILFALFAFASIQTATANTEPETNSATEIRDLLQTTLSEAELATGDKIYITFMLNDDNQVLVLNTNNDTYDKSIKQRLNYKSLTSVDLEKGKKYTLPVSLKK